jgi:hypothetical protein
MTGCWLAVKRVTRIHVLLVAMILVPSVSVTVSHAVASRSLPSAPTAHAAKVISLNDKVRMHLVSKHGSIVVERGEATGSVFLSPLISTFTGVNAEHGTATLAGYSRNSSVRGHAELNAYTVGHIIHFDGLMAINGGTGSYAHVHGQGLRFKGTIDRHNFNTSAELTGKLQG